MDRVPAYLAISSGKTPSIFGALGGATATLEPDGLWRIDIEKNGHVGQLLMRRIADELPEGGYPAVGGSWDIWGILPAGVFSEDGAQAEWSWTIGTRAFRALGRLRSSDRNEDASGKHYIAGPWSPMGLWSLLPADLRESIFRPHTGGVPTPGAPLRCPWVLAGDSPEALYSVNYAPSELEIANDVETTRAALFGR